MNEALIGYCGLYCGGCREYQKTKANDPATEEDGTPRYCDGCKSDRTTIWCTECKIKECNRAKGFSTCAECTEYPCARMNAFINDENYKYHLETTRDIEEIRKCGLQEWAEKKERAYYCKKCNNLNNWWEQECTQCGSKLLNGKCP